MNHDYLQEAKEFYRSGVEDLDEGNLEHAHAKLAAAGVALELRRAQFDTQLLEEQRRAVELMEQDGARSGLKVQPRILPDVAPPPDPADLSADLDAESVRR